MSVPVLEVPQPVEPATPVVPEPSPVPADPEPPVEPGTPGHPARHAARAPDRSPRARARGVDSAAMGFDQYHEPPAELPEATRTFARLCASLTEEAEAIGWYEQRLAIEKDPEAVAVMSDAVGEEYKHF